MAELIAWQFQQRRNLRRNRIFRDTIHPLEKYDDVELYNKFRFRRCDILAITGELQEALEMSNQHGVLPPLLQVLLTLRFYASGSFQDVCGELVGVHQTTASRTITRVTDAFMQHVPTWVQFPNQREADRTKRKIFRAHQFPNVIGCIDGTHIRIQSPGIDNEHEFINRKNFPSINVQVICDADLRFIDVTAKWPGSVHDARILRQSALFAVFEGQNKPVEGLILGDSGYMVRDWLMTPILHPQTRRQENFNNHHSSARTTVERCIGIAKRRWHCLRRLRVAPSKACRIITVCLMLHNRARSLNLADLESDSDDGDSDDGDSDDGDSDDEAPDINIPVGANPTERVRTAAGKAVRDRLVNTFF